MGKVQNKESSNLLSCPVVYAEIEVLMLMKLMLTEFHIYKVLLPFLPHINIQ
jgi:hypothetical protein